VLGVLDRVAEQVAEQRGQQRGVAAHAQHGRHVAQPQALGRGPQPPGVQDRAEQLGQPDHAERRQAVFGAGNREGDAARYRLRVRHPRRLPTLAPPPAPAAGFAACAAFGHAAGGDNK
jgi:hypothetical protein